MDIDAGNFDFSQHSRFHFDQMHWTDPVRYGTVLLYQIGDLGCEGSYTTGPHRQFCYEISCIVSGQGHFSTDGKRYRVSKGDLYFSKPGEIHDVVSDNADPIRYFYVAFDISPDGRQAGGLESVLMRVSARDVPLAKDRYDLQTPFVRIFNELIHEKEYSFEVIEGCLKELLVFTFRNFCEIENGIYVPKPTMDHARQLVYDIINYIDENCCRIIDLTELCGRFGYSYSYLSHIFTREIGQSLKEYLDSKRFHQAADWLVNSSLSITEIAAKLKYQSIHTFSRAFRACYHMSPTLYRASFRGKTMAAVDS